MIINEFRVNEKYHRSYVFCFILLALFLAISGCQIQQVKRADAKKLDLELQDILSSFTGYYQGISTNPDAKNNPDANPTMEVFNKVLLIDAPQFGEIVLYHQLSRNSFDGPAFQQKIYVFDTTESRMNNRMRSYYIFPGQGLVNIEKNSDVIKAIKPDALMSFPRGCMINWEKMNREFIASVRKEDCYYHSTKFKQIVRSDMVYTIDSKDFKVHEAMFKNNGEMIFTMEKPLSTHRVY